MNETRVIGNEEQFSLLLASIKDYAIFIIDPDGYILSWNAGAQAIKGYTETEIIGKHISIFYTEADRQNGEPERNLANAKAHGRHEQEGWRVRKDGSKFWADVIFSAMYDAEGLLMGFSKVTRDVTEKKKAEEALKQLNAELELRVVQKVDEVIRSERKLRMIIENNTDIITMFDEKLLPFYRGPASERITGWDDSSRSTMASTDLIHPEDVEKFMGYIDETRQHPEKLIPVDFRSLHRDGHYIWFDGVMSNMLGDLDLKAIILNVRDVSERKIAEKKLRDSLKELRDYKYALDESDIVAITNQKGIITYVNDNFCKISKYSKEELIGQDHRIINSGYHPKAFIKNLWNTIAKGNIWRGELKNKAKDGTIYWVQTTIVPFLDDMGKPYQYIAIRSDITERKRVEEEIIGLNETLETKVKDRTVQLQEANNELESFSYSVSHDLRAPLRAVGGYAKILGEDYSQSLDEEANRLLKVIQENAKKMGMLIDDLLSFSKLGRKEMKKTTIDMGILAREVLFELSGSHEIPANITIHPLQHIVADYSLIYQVAFNLLSNAIKYSSKNENPLVEMKSEETEDGVTYSVADNGVGFDMKYAHKLFGVFQRLHADAEFEGTGVGLAIVQRIITKHGGKVWAEAELGKGATFYFTLPKKHRLNS